MIPATRSEMRSNLVYEGSHRSIGSRSKSCRLQRRDEEGVADGLSSDWMSSMPSEAVSVRCLSGSSGMVSGD